MKKYITIIFCFLFINIYSQSRNTIYFLINKKDTLIKKYNPSNRKSFEGYEVYFTEKTKIKKNNTPWPKDSLNSGTIKVWVADTKYDYYVYEHNSYTFSYLNNKSKLISEKCLNSLNYIESRENFLNIKKLLFNYTIFFIEKLNKDNYIIHEMYPIFYE